MGQMHHISEGDMVLLTALLDGALDPQQSDALRQRLADDDTLHDAYLDLVLIRDQLTQLPLVRVPRSFRLDEASFRRARGWHWWLNLPPGGVFAPALSAVASLVVVIFFVRGLFVVPTPADMNQMMVAPVAESFVLEEAPAAQSRMLESAPMMAYSEPVSDDVTVMVASESDSSMLDTASEVDLAAPVAPMLLTDMGYQPYGDAWFNRAIAGIVIGAIVLASSLRWLIQVWWRQRHQRS